MSFSIFSAQSIIRGQKKSKWLDTSPTIEVPVPLCFEDQEQIDAIHTWNFRKRIYCICLHKMLCRTLYIL